MAPVVAPITLLEPAPAPETWLAPVTEAPVAPTTTTAPTTTAAPTTLAEPVPQATTTATAPTAAAAPVPAAPTTATGARLFAPDSVWNAVLAPDAPLDAKSSTYVADIQRQLLTYLPWINTSQHSEPVYTVPADQPLVRVTLDKAGTDSQTVALREAWKAVPVPPSAVPAAGVDKNLVVQQPSTDTLWEFWGMQKLADGWHAKWGGKMTDVSTNPGYFTLPNNRWGAAATSLPLLGGLMRLDELQSGGPIDHALALSLPETRADYYSWPAQRTDGQVNSPDAIPEGTRFRLPASLDLSKIPMSPLVRRMAVAAQRYGIVVRDRSGSIAFYGEDPTPTGSTLYTTLLGGKYPSTLLATFPWAKLQALQTKLAYDPI